MASFTEFYLTTMWTYKPNVVRQVIDDLTGMGFGQAEFTYDSEYGWFKVTCLEEQADEIRHKFAVIAREIEENAFDTYEDNMLDTHDVLLPSFDNEWFSQAPDAASSCELDEADDSYCRPKPLTKYPNTGVWDDLDKDNEPYMVCDIMGQRELDEIQDDLNVKMTIRLAGKLVYIAGQSEESVGKARERLRVMLAMRKLRPGCLRAVHLVYAEDYANPVMPSLGDTREIRADMRYLANIDPKLASSTLLDRLTVDKLEESYKKIYQQACSIRICPWSPDKSCFVSLLGPKVSAKSRDRTMLGNRPKISTRTIEKLALPAKEPSSPVLHRATEGASKVETWIAKVQAHVGPVTDTGRSLLDAQAVGRPTLAPAGEDLIDFHQEPLTTHHGPASGNAAAKPDTTLLDDDCPLPALSQDFSALRLEPGTSGAETMSNSLLKELAFTGDDCLVDMLAAVATPVPEGCSTQSVTWRMPSLVPAPTQHEEDEDGTADSDMYLSVLEKSPRKSKTATSSHQTDQQATAAGNRSVRDCSGGLGAQQTKEQKTTQQAAYRNPSRYSVYPTPPPDRGSIPRDPDRLLATEAFRSEIEAAVARLLSMGPYRRGRVAARFEFGRIILEGASDTGLAFNPANTRSNGWVKPELVGRLNRGYGENQNVHFTNVLSTYAYDIEDMIGMTANGSRLWEERPSRAWTTYSFHCALRSTDKLRRFIVDIEDDGTSGNGFSYFIRVPHDVPSQDKPMPVYVHAIRRHWDLRIVTAHVRPEDMDKAYECLAITLLQSLSVSVTEKGLPELRFAVRNDFTVDVNEVRVLSKWRYSSLNGKSALEITEVQQMEMVPCSEGVYSGSWDSWEGKLARPWSHRRIKENRAKGEFPRWYEAAVVSLELDELCRQNASLQVGEKADWDVQDLKSRGVFSTLYGPALHMVAQMDHVGRLDDNNLEQAYGHLLRRPNDSPRHVPGSARYIPGSAPAQAGQRGSQQRGAGRSDTAMSEALSAQASTASGHGSSTYRNPAGPARRPEESDSYKFW